MISDKIKEILYPQTDEDLFSWASIKDAIAKIEVTPVSDVIGIVKYDFIKSILIHGDGTIVKLTTKENRILNILNNKRNTTVKHQDVLMDVWGRHDYYTMRCMNVYMMKVKKKIMHNNPNVGFLNVHGDGYALIINE